MTEKDLQLAYNQTPYLRVIFQDKIFIEIDVTAELLGIHRSTFMRLIRKLKKAFDMSIYIVEYKNRWLIHESLVSVFFKLVREMENNSIRKF
jgi:hypothetical protein